MVQPAAPVRADVRPSEIEPPRQGITKEDYIAPPSSSRGPVRVLGRKSVTTTTAKPVTNDDRKKPAQRREPVINVKLPSMPRGHAAPTAAPKSNEPAPQKPEIRLTPELLAKMDKGGGVTKPPPLLTKVRAQVADQNLPAADAWRWPSARSRTSRTGQGWLDSVHR